MCRLPRIHYDWRPGGAPRQAAFSRERPERANAEGDLAAEAAKVVRTLGKTHGDMFERRRGGARLQCRP